MQKFTLMMLTCDKYSDIWPAYFGQLRKYWPQYTGEIFVNTESKRVEGTGIKNIISYPTENFQWNTPWSYRLYKCLEQIQTEYVIFLMDDFILTDYVDQEEIEKDISYMENDKTIACFNYLPIPGEPEAIKYERYMQMPKKTPFRINLQAALWRKSYLMKFIRKHENPWQFENWGSIRARRYSDKIYHLRKDAKRVFIYPDGGIIADERWHTEAAVELLKKEGYNIDFSARTIYHKGDARKTEIVHRTFIQKCWQVFKSLI